MEKKQQENKTDHSNTRMLFRIAIGLFLGTVLVELGMSTAMYFLGLIEQPMDVYVPNYMVRPILASALFLVGGLIVGRLVHKATYKQRAYVIAITLMFANIVHVHNVYMILFFVFCVPILLTVVLQDLFLLHIVTLISEMCVIGTTIYCSINQLGAAIDRYYVPSAAFAVILLFVCELIAGKSVKVLISKDEMLRQTAEEAEKANKSKSIFLSNMSHEIRTPINAVLGLDEMILRESGEEKIREYAQDIQTSGNALLGLVNDVLDFSKIEAGRMDLIPVEYDVTSLVNDLVNTIAKRAMDHGLAFDVQVDKRVPKTLFGDEIRIRQIALNILTNAVKYTEKGSVTMKVSSSVVDEKHVCLAMEIADTGRGMSKEDLDRLFSPFVRFEEKENRNVEGTGLGMSITKNLLQMMRSELHVTSEVQKGSVFSFGILQEVRNPEPIGDYNARNKRERLKKNEYKAKFTAPDARVLAVDDVVLNIKVLKGLLKKTQVQIDTAMSGRECLELAAENKYDLFFIDHMMPEMDGVEVLAHLQEDAYKINRDVPKIALTANAISGAKEKYLELGFDEYLTKPVEADKLEDMMMQLLPAQLVHPTVLPAGQASTQ